MDRTTTAFYQRYVEGGAIQSEAARSAISKHFVSAFLPGGRVLDIGSGSGRDLSMLLQSGFDAYGIEPNETMRSFALRSRPELAGRLQTGFLPAIGEAFHSQFDGVVCSAVLMHIPDTDLPASAQAIRALLNPGGRVLISLPCMRPDLLDGERDQDGRFFKNHTPESISAHLGNVGLTQIDRWNDGEHANTLWFSLLYELTDQY